MKKVYIIAILTLMGQSSWAQIRDFQTTRLTSTAGAGVASILSTEAAVLNPSTAAFFNDSSFSYQSYSTSLRHESDERPGAEDFKSTRSQGFFMSDHTGPVKGGVSYLMQKENGFERSQMVGHGAAGIGEGTSMGFAYKYINDVLPAGSSNRHRTHHQMTVGLLQVLSENSLLGLVVIDPTRTTPREERVIAGFQYGLTDRFTLIGDAGAQFTRAFNKKYLWRGALQLNVFDDFFLRIGRFYDNVTELKGMGWGASWIGPRLGIEFAQKISDQFASNSYVYEDESIVDTSISAIIKF